MIRQFPRLLYLLEREDGAFKVGSSAFPAQRMRTLEDEQGYDFVLLQEWEHPNAFDLELRIHRALKRRKDTEYCHNGGRETYIASRDIVLQVIKEQMDQWHTQPRKVRRRCGTCQSWRNPCDTGPHERCEAWVQRQEPKPE